MLIAAATTNAASVSGTSRGHTPAVTIVSSAIAPAIDTITSSLVAYSIKRTCGRSIARRLSPGDDSVVHRREQPRVQFVGMRVDRGNEIAEFRAVRENRLGLRPRQPLEPIAVADRFTEAHVDVGEPAGLHEILQGIGVQRLAMRDI